MSKANFFEGLIHDLSNRTIMRVILFVILVLSVISCSEQLVETNQLSTIHEYNIGSDHEFKIIGDNITIDVADALSKQIEKQVRLAELAYAKNNNVNEKSWGDIEFIPIGKKNGYFWNQIGKNSITYQSYAINYLHTKNSGADAIVVHQFPVNSNKSVLPFLFEAYDLSGKDYQMTCVRAKLYGHDAKIISKNTLLHNEIRVFGKGECALDAEDVIEELGWTVR